VCLKVTTSLSLLVLCSTLLCLRFASPALPPAIPPRTLPTTSSTAPGRRGPRGASSPDQRRNKNKESLFVYNKNKNRWRSIKSVCSNVSTFLNPPAACNDVLTVAATEMGNLFNPYDLDAPMCVQEETNRMRLAVSRLFSFPDPLPYLPCEDLFIQTYLNRQDVQAALHVIPNTTQSGWTDCVNDTRWNYDYSGSGCS
jgi:hypothetical protein